MPDKCVVFGCNNRPNKGKGISLHPIPFDGTDDTEKRKRRKKWVVGVLVSVLVGNPRNTDLAVCSKHFLDEDYSIMFSDLAKFNFQRRLRKDGIAICVFPTIRVPCISMEGKSTASKRR